MNKKTLRTLEDLIQHELIDQKDLPNLQTVVEDFSLAISDSMLQLIDKTNPEDPIAKQFVPSIQELTISASESTDPIGDHVHAKVKGIIHRYPDRCLFMPVHVCPVYCRFCFRKEKVGESSQTMSPAELQAALTYLREHKEIWEVILSGGDPLILKPATLKKLIQELNSIEHIEVIRIHTRVPVVDPARINLEMIDALKCEKPVYVLLHANHPNEFSPAAKKACALLVDAGIPMLSQTILLKDLNDNIDVLSQLMRCFIKNRIKPYYLHHGDLARGTQHFRATIAKGQELMKQLRGRFSGLCQPTYVLDIPGGYGKTPIGPNYVEMGLDSLTDYQIEDYEGQIHNYSET
ncbi:MAG: lysine-2,3-aminomutase-like protein [Gammaproteobacteria bacterium]